MGYGGIPVPVPIYQKTDLMVTAKTFLAETRRVIPRRHPNVAARRRGNLPFGRHSGDDSVRTGVDPVEPARATRRDQCWGTTAKAKLDSLESSHPRGGR